jgi:hypothetical protein
VEFELGRQKLDVMLSYITIGRQVMVATLGMALGPELRTALGMALELE